MTNREGVGNIDQFVTARAKDAAEKIRARRAAARGASAPDGQPQPPRPVPEPSRPEPPVETEAERQKREDLERCTEINRKLLVYDGKLLRLFALPTFDNSNLKEAQEILEKIKDILSKLSVRLYEQAGYTDPNKAYQDDKEWFSMLETKIKKKETELAAGAGEPRPEPPVPTPDLARPEPSSPLDRVNKKEFQEKERRVTAEIEGHKSYIVQILAKRVIGETEKTEFNEHYEGMRVKIDELGAHYGDTPSPKEKEKLSGYKKDYTDYRVQAVVRGVFGAADLDESRRVLVIAQKRVEDLQKLGHGLMSFLHRGSRDKVRAELAKANAEYEAKLKEATMADRAVMIDERMKLVDAKLAAYRGGREKRTLYERYKGLSEINLDNWLQKRGTNLADKGLIGRVAKRGARMVNARTAVSIGLFAGAGLSGAYLGVGVGLAASRIRGAWSGVGTGAGTYEMINMARRALSSSLSDKQIGEMSANQAVQYMASYEVRAQLDGMDLSKNAEYQKLVARYKSAMEAKGKKADGTELVGQELYDSLKGELNFENTSQRSELNKERWIRRTAFVAGAVVGGTMYSWIVKKVQAAAEAKQLAEDQAQMAAISGVSKTADVDLPNPMHPHPVKGMPEFIKGSDIPKVESQFNYGDIVGEETSTPSAGAVQEAAPTPSVAGAVEAPTEPIRADMEVTVKPGGVVTETPVKITEQTPVVSKPDNVIYGEGLPETPTEPGVGVAEKIVKIRAGATMEVGAAGDAIVHAGKRGIEGALIDLKNTDPDRYAKMLTKLQEHYQAPNGKFENLVHRFVLDNSDGKDLNRVFSADIHISSDGELSMSTDDIKLMPSAQSTAGLAPETNPSLKGPSFDEGFDQPNPLEKFQFGDQPTSGLGSVPKPTFGVDIKDLHTPGALDANLTDFDYDDSELVQHAREVAADSILSPEKIAGKVEKLSDALHLVLGNKYDTFLDQIHISARSLNKVKDLTIGNFTEQIEDGAIDKKKFQGLIDAMVKWQQGEKISRAAFDKMPIKKVMLEIAKFYKHNS